MASSADEVARSAEKSTRVDDAADDRVGEPVDGMLVAGVGTVVWVGPTRHPEFFDAYRYCKSVAPQIATRRSLTQLIARPASAVTHLIVARADRCGTPAAWGSVRQRYATAEFISIASSLCDGHKRSGDPWPDLATIRFSRWDEVLPSWFGIRLRRPLHRASVRKSVLVVADRYEIAEPLLDWLSDGGHTALWQRSAVAARMRNIDAVIWDDSAAPPTCHPQWQRRMAPFIDASATTPSRERSRQIWLALQPTAAEIADAKRGGVADVLTKPVALDALAGCLSTGSRLHCSPAR